MASAEKSPAPSTPAPAAAPAEPAQSSPLALIVPLAILTVVGAGAGGLFGTMALPPAHAPAAAKPAAEHGSPSKHGGPALGAGSSLKMLAPITTNLAGQKSTWVRLESAILLEGPPPEDIEALGGKIGDDILAFLRTVQLGQIEGASGFQNLREDLNDLVRIRSAGKVRELVIQTLIVE
jgi:flagellar FliL protein